MSKIKIIIFSLIAIIASLFLVLISDTTNNYYEAQTVYRVYLNGESIGLIKSPNELDRYINVEQEQLKEEYNVNTIHIPQGLEIKQELTYNEEIKKSSEIYEEIKDKEPFTIEGYVVTVYREESSLTEDGSRAIETGTATAVVATKISVLDKQIFLDAIDQTIAAFIDKDAYEAYVNEEQPKIQDLEEGSLIQNVYLKEEVYIKKDYISVNEEIFTDSKTLAKYLLYGTTKSQKTYSVKSGDTIESIANNNQLNVREFLIANKDISSQDSLLYTGQQVIVDLINPVLTVVEETTETKYQEKKFSTEIIKDESIFVGYSEVVQQGANGEEYVTMKILKENGKVLTALTTDSVETKAPINRIVKTGARTEFVVGNTGIWVWPTRVSGSYISTYFGWDSDLGYTRFHYAIDITGTGCGSPIYAANDGTVEKVAYDSRGLGNYIVVNHNNGYVTWYCHLQTRGYVSVGQAVEMGQVIGKMGDTGYSFGCHVHFITSYNGTRFNPLQLYK